MKQSKSTFWKDFKAFVMRGNVLDMAVGVVIGSAFSKIVSSFVESIITPLLSVLLGRINLASLAFTINNSLAQGDPIVISYGVFLQNILDFIIVAFCIFVAIRFIGKLHRKKEEAPAAPPAPSKEELLLTEIRDLLKNK